MPYPPISSPILPLDFENIPFAFVLLYFSLCVLIIIIYLMLSLLIIFKQNIKVNYFMSLPILNIGFRSRRHMAETKDENFCSKGVVTSNPSFVFQELWDVGLGVHMNLCPHHEEMILTNSSKIK